MCSRPYQFYTRIVHFMYLVSRYLLSYIDRLCTTGKRPTGQLKILFSSSIKLRESKTAVSVIFLATVNSLKSVDKML